MAPRTLQLMERKSDAQSAELSADHTDKPLPLKIAYIGGGSRGWAHNLMKDLLMYPGFTGEVRLYDIDRPAADLNERYGTWLQGHPQAASKWKYRAVGSLKNALTGADFVFASIQPGSITLMQHDLEEPMKYGIYQPVGDTVGPGGCIRALRSVKDYLVIGRAIQQYAPDAWVINFTNPMSVCTRTLYEAYPGIKAFGCCHEVFGSQGTLAHAYSSMTGNPRPARQEIDVNVLGINHFTWINRARYGSTDLLALYRDYINTPGTVRKFTKKQLSSDSVFAGKGQVKYELFKQFGIMAAAGDRHLAEFVPWFLTDKNSCYRWGFVLTPYSYRINRYRQAPKLFRAEMRKNEFTPLNGSGEEYINQMRALMGGSILKTNVNLPNRGQMQGAPLGAVVETNALFSRDNVQPIASGALPANVNTLVLPHINNQESLVKAVVTNDKNLAFQAFINDPLVNIPIDDAWTLFNTMLKKTGFTFKG